MWGAYTQSWKMPIWDIYRCTLGDMLLNADLSLLSPVYVFELDPLRSTVLGLCQLTIMQQQAVSQNWKSLELVTGCTFSPAHSFFRQALLLAKCLYKTIKSNGVPECSHFTLRSQLQTHYNNNIKIAKPWEIESGEKTRVSGREREWRDRKVLARALA